MHLQLCGLNILQLMNAILFSVAVQIYATFWMKTRFVTTAICWFWSFVMWFFSYKYNQMLVNTKFIKIQCFRNGVENCICTYNSFREFETIRTFNFQFNWKALFQSVYISWILMLRIYLNHLIRVICEDSPLTSLLF